MNMAASRSRARCARSTKKATLDSAATATARATTSSRTSPERQSRRVIRNDWDNKAAKPISARSPGARHADRLKAQRRNNHSNSVNTSDTSTLVLNGR